MRSKPRSPVVDAQLMASILELLHPEARCGHRLGLGTAALSLVPSNSDVADADLVIIVGTRGDCRQKGWLEQVVQTMASVLSRDGLAYVLIPRRSRPRLLRLLARHGLVAGPFIVHVPDTASSDQLVPLDPVALRYALASTGRASTRRAALARAVRGHIATMLGLLVASAGCVVRRRGGRPLWEWLYALDGEERVPQRVILLRSFHKDKKGIVLLRFAGRDREPSAVAKTVLREGDGERIVREAMALTRVASVARMAGVVAPKPLAFLRLDGRPILLETAVGGQPLARLLAASPERLLEAFELITGWLARWHGLTAHHVSADTPTLERELLTPARVLAPLLSGGGDYLRRLERECALLLGTEVPRAAAHNDLTMVNVTETNGLLGVLDWEEASESEFPLVDFFYSVVDAAAATSRYADRPTAFAQCFLPGGLHARAIASLEQRMTDAADAPESFIALAFHSCWLRHAANEHARGTGAAFLAIAQSMIDAMPLRHRLSCSTNRYSK